MINEALEAVEEYRKVLNDGDSYKKSNIETINSYKGKDPYWEYNDLTHNLRSHNEIILSSVVNFYLSGKKVASTLAMEIFKKEFGVWRLYRQHMERYSE